MISNQWRRYDIKLSLNTLLSNQAAEEKRKQLEADRQKREEERKQREEEIKKQHEEEERKATAERERIQFEKESQRKRVSLNWNV